MSKKILFVLVMSFLFVSLLLTSIGAVQLRPMNQLNHPGINNPHQSGGYSSTYNRWWSELCEPEHANSIWPMNQGLNIPKFFICCFNGGDY